MTSAMPTGLPAARPLPLPSLEPSGAGRVASARPPAPRWEGPEFEEPTAQEPLRTSSLGCHAHWYRENLGHCNEPMLQYEWAWINRRLTALQRCSSGEAGELACPPRSRLEPLLSESQLLRTLLLQEFASRGLRPLPPRGTVVPSEEAWEITSASVRQEWGMAS